jgi:plastocyanin domain-containing protein
MTDSTIRNARPRPLFHLPLALACVMALGLVGCGGTPPAEEHAEAPAAIAVQEGVVEVTVDGAGFHPDRIAAKAGEPITLALTRTTDETCGTEIVIASLGIEQKLPLNERVEVTVTPGEKGEIAFACGMDMLKGAIVVE